MLSYGLSRKSCILMLVALINYEAFQKLIIDGKNNTINYDGHDPNS